MIVAIDGVLTPGGDEPRLLVLVKVRHNDQDYDWQTYAPADMLVQDYLPTCVDRLKAEIDAKEAEWAALTPKTKEIVDPFTGETTVVELQKSEVVCPEIPDYYAKRRAEYPSIGDQLDAMWKGGQIAADMLAEIQAVKDKYPKPE